LPTLPLDKATILDLTIEKRSMRIFFLRVPLPCPGSGGYPASCTGPGMMHPSRRPWVAADPTGW